MAAGRFPHRPVRFGPINPATRHDQQGSEGFTLAFCKRSRLARWSVHHQIPFALGDPAGGVHGCSLQVVGYEVKGSQYC